MTLPGTRFKTNERKCILQTTLWSCGASATECWGWIWKKLPRAVKCVADGGACAGSRAWEGAGGALLSACCGVTVVQHLLQAAVDCVDNGLVLWQTKKAAVVPFIFPAFTVNLE